MTIKVLEGTIEMKSPSASSLEAPLIQHGEGAAHPAVFGDQLLAYLNQLVTMFNAHVHPGELGGRDPAGDARAARAAAAAADAGADLDQEPRGVGGGCGRTS